MYRKIIDIIKEYDHIVIYRHVNPDLDCFGGQLGLYECLSKSFPKKSIYVAGEFSSDILKFYDVKFDIQLPDFDASKVLGIVVDTANRDRIDGDSYIRCDKLIKIDHHIIVDSYGDINLEIPTASSCCEIVGDIFKEFSGELVITKEAAEAVYLGIIGDSNRFMYSTTNPVTFKVAGYLLEQGVDFTKLFKKMYTRTKKDLDIQGFILNSYKTDGPVAYYVLTTKDLEKLNICREEGSNYVFSLANVEEFKVWMAITQNDVDGNWRVSIRSRDTTINDIAAQFNGGGHAFASGAKLNNIDQLELLVSKIKERIYE